MIAAPLWPAHRDGSPRPLGDLRPAERLAYLDGCPAEVLDIVQPRQRTAAAPAQPVTAEAAAAQVALIMAATFARPREQRSAAYLLGVRAALLRQVIGASVVCPWVPGTTERDAYFAGVDEGNVLWRCHTALPAGGRARP